MPSSAGPSSSRARSSGSSGPLVTLGLAGARRPPLTRFMFDFFRVLPIRVDSLARDLAVLVLGVGGGLGVFGSWVSVRDAT